MPDEATGYARCPRKSWRGLTKYVWSGRMSEVAVSPLPAQDVSPQRGRGRPRQFDVAQAMAVAKILFRTRGYDRVTLHDLTSAMGISPPSFYAAFGNKALLFVRIADVYASEWLAQVRGAFDDESSLADALEAIVLNAARRFAWQDAGEEGGGWGGCLILEAACNCSDAGVTAHLRKGRLSIAAALYRGISRTAPERVVELTDHVMTLLVGFSAMGRDGVGQERMMAVARRAVTPLCDALSRI